ncbi:hypothetical protein G3M48_010145 [Beauveria asiatica]|uniref:Precorrin-2 dehydrogenase n=1 Tax=Beauveria asiatica TaxID=1069075 RepID=A0AAW0S8L1_9HYPO
MDGQDSKPNVLLAGLDCRGSVHLVVGTNPLAASRCAASLAAGAHPVLVAPGADASTDLHYGLQAKIDDGSVKWERKPLDDEDLFRLGRAEVGGVVDAVFVTTGTRETNTHIATLCRRNRIPVNVVDAPDLCTLTLLSTHVDGPLQIGVTTNGRGCKLASRIRREIAASLPANLGAATARLGDARRRIIQQDYSRDDALSPSSSPPDEDDSTGQSAAFNKLVVQDADEIKTRRMRWLSQVCEYWPLSRLASITDDDVATLLTSYQTDTAHSSSSSSSLPSLNPNPDSSKTPKLGRLLLAGSGPGHPDLLTRATHRALLSADIILADKLVPAGVLALIPRRTPVSIARKFPGNADRAQEELLAAAHAGVLAGQTVLRLKQGDPFLYGRGGEEVAWFRAKGLGDRVAVLPGMTSALSAPLFAGIPATQRDVADQVLICTGTGKKGAAPAPPEFVASRTVVFLMALHRIAGLVRELTTTAVELEQDAPSSEKMPPNVTTMAPPTTTRRLWPLTTPCAVVERASCPDQRVIRTTLARVAEAVEEEGSRPPGLLVVGAACTALEGPLDRGRAWVVEEGFRGLDGLDGLDGFGGLQEAMAAATGEGPAAVAA